MSSQFNLATSFSAQEMINACNQAATVDEAVFVEYDDMGNKCISFYVQRGDVKITDAEYRANTIQMFRMVDSELQ